MGRHESRGGGLKQRTAAFNELVEEAISLFHRLRHAAELVHGAGELSGGRRGALLGLERTGAQTVPQMARARPVSRQHMQMVVNELLDEGFVEQVDNPAHKRSALIRLTTKGKSYIEEMHKREREMHRRIDLGLTVEEMREASRILRLMRERLASEEWEQAAAIICPAPEPKPKRRNR